jgi:nucleoside-diphosphate-sugar epimerase
MRIVVLGGTRFIGRALVEDLVGAAHEVQVVHRGETEPEDLASVEHLHLRRSELSENRDHLTAYRPDAAVDCRAMTLADARTALSAFPSGLRLVVLSSMDVYRAYGSLRAGLQTDPVPLDETAPVRRDRYPYRGEDPSLHDYEKLDVEEEYLTAGATILRLPMVYGEHDYQRREEFILRRVRAGRTRIPVGPGTWLSCWGYVREIARGVRLALESDGVAGEVVNLAQVPTWPARLLAERILDAAGSTAGLVRVPEEVLPDDLGITRSLSQHLLTDPRKARERLGWVHADPEEGLRASVAWHLANPPEDVDTDFSADDRALAAAALV